jgi:hypothetical protein
MRIAALCFGRRRFPTALSLAFYRALSARERPKYFAGPIGLIIGYFWKCRLGSSIPS